MLTPRSSSSGLLIAEGPPLLVALNSKDLQAALSGSEIPQ